MFNIYEEIKQLNKRQYPRDRIHMMNRPVCLGIKEMQNIKLNEVLPDSC